MAPRCRCGHSKTAYRRWILGAKYHRCRSCTCGLYFPAPAIAEGN